MAALAATGTVAARPQGRARRSKLDPYETFLRTLIDEKVDITLEEMRAGCRTSMASPSGSARCGPSSTRAT